MEAVCRDDYHDNCTAVDVVVGISRTMVVAGIGYSTSIVGSMTGAGWLIFGFSVANFLT